MTGGPRVVLAQPSYGEVTAGAARGFFRASRLPDALDADPAAGAVHRVYAEGSLLASNFNSAWCEALNLARGGGRVDYFAMIHADVEPADRWLDTLIDELESRGLDVLGVAIPIKDPFGVTSLALGRPDGDTWRPLCRLSMTEVYRLPETFTSEDVGHQLLLNTGLWVCRFDPAWAAKVWFTIHDRIGFDVPAGVYKPYNESEDWFFSRLLHEVGMPGSPTEGVRPLRVGATRKVPALHRGPARFTNRHAWGRPFDAPAVAASPLPQVPPSGAFVLPAVDGWLAYEEGAALADLARGKRVLEVGSYCGLSTICMARTARRVVAVDTFDGRGTPKPGRTLDEFRANLSRYGVEAETWPGTFAAFARDVAPHLDPFDLIFIDGAHDRASVESDVGHARPLLAPDGLLACHDYCAAHPGVTAAVDELIASGGELVSLTGSLAVVRPPAAVPPPSPSTAPTPALLEV